MTSATITVPELKGSPQDEVQIRLVSRRLDDKVLRRMKKYRESDPSWNED